VHGSLPTPKRSACRQFCRKAGDRCDPHSAKKLRLDVREARQSRREGLWLGVLEVICNHPPWDCSPGEAIDDSGVRIILCRTSEIHQCFDLLIFGTDRVEHESTPEGALFECFEIEPGNNPEVVGSTFQGKEQIGIGLSIGVDYLTIREYNLKLVSQEIDVRVGLQTSKLTTLSTTKPYLGPKKENPPDNIRQQVIVYKS